MTARSEVRFPVDDNVELGAWLYLPKSVLRASARTQEACAYPRRTLRPLCVRVPDFMRCSGRLVSPTPRALKEDSPWCKRHSLTMIFIGMYLR